MQVVAPRSVRHEPSLGWVSHASENVTEPLRRSQPLHQHAALRTVVGVHPIFFAQGQRAPNLRRFLTGDLRIESGAALSYKNVAAIVNAADKDEPAIHFQPLVF